MFLPYIICVCLPVVVWVFFSVCLRSVSSVPNVDSISVVVLVGETEGPGENHLPGNVIVRVFVSGLVQSLRFLRMKPIILLALETVLSMCLDYCKSSLMVTPK